MSRKFQFKRGLRANLPTLAVAEPAFTTDDGKLHVGSGNGNITMAREDHKHSLDDVSETTSKKIMTADERTKLGGIAAGANAYTHPSYTARTGKPTANATPAFGGTFTVSQIKSDATGHVTSATDRTVTIPNTEATTSAAGLMSASDKSKLDGIATGANKITVDSALSSSSTNPVQNKVVNSALAGKSNTGHTHTMANVSETDSQKKVYRASASASDGATYTATVDGITALTSGVKLTIVPSMTATSTSPTLNVNSLGAKQIRRKLSAGTATRSALQNANTVYKDVPLELMYDGTYWVATQFTKPAAADLYGTVAIANGGTGCTAIADTTYTTARYRASALVSADTNPTTNGVINWTYK